MGLPAAFDTGAGAHPAPFSFASKRRRDQTIPLNMRKEFAPS